MIIWQDGGRHNMLIQTRFFAAHRERLGVDRLEIELPAQATVADLVDDVVRRHPDLAALLGSSRFAVNREYLPATTVLKPGDEVAFIPPVAGGGDSEW
jgi:molybdopterin converting factor subunit 1